MDLNFGQAYQCNRCSCSFLKLNDFSQHAKFCRTNSDASDELNHTPLIFASENGGPTPTRGLQFETLNDLHADKLNPFDAAFRSENTTDKFLQRSRNDSDIVLKPDSPIVNVVDDDDPAVFSQKPILTRCDTLPLDVSDSSKNSSQHFSERTNLLSMVQSLSGSSDVANIMKSESLMNSISQFATQFISGTASNNAPISPSSANDILYRLAGSFSSHDIDVLPSNCKTVPSPKIISVASLTNTDLPTSPLLPTLNVGSKLNNSNMEGQVIAYMPNGQGVLMPFVIPIGQLNTLSPNMQGSPSTNNPNLPIPKPILNPNSSVSLQVKEATSPIQLSGVTSTSCVSENAQNPRAYLRELLKRKLGESDDSSISNSPKSTGDKSRAIMVDCDVESNDDGPSAGSIPSDLNGNDPRKERNRIAARKCRDKKKSYIKQLEKKVATWETKYKTLDIKYQNVKKSYDTLLQILNSQIMNSHSQHISTSMDDNTA